MNTAFITSAPTQYQVMLDNYAGIIEKTNQQLGLWSNPYGIMIGVLTLMVALGAIVVAYYIWKNSKEQKDLFKEVMLSQKKHLEDQYNILTEQKKAELDKVIADFEKTKDSVSAEKKAEFQKLIDEYKGEKEKLGAPKTFLDTSLSATSLYVLSNQEKNMNCTTCGRSFRYIDDDSSGFGKLWTSVSAATIYGGYGNSKKVCCAHCGAVNIAQ